MTTTDPAPALLDDSTTATLVAHLGGNAVAEGYWPNDDADAFAVALGQRAIAGLGLLDDQADPDLEDPRSLAGYLAALNIEPLITL